MAYPAQESTLVGLCDGEIDPRRHRCSFLTNKVGGLPDWPPDVSPPAPSCARCGAPLTHVVQVYCPLGASSYHRNLHLFACPRAACSGRTDGWKVLRSQSLEQAPSRPDPAQGAPRPATDWCDSADDWGVEEEEDDGLGPDGGVEEAAAPQTHEDPELEVSSRLQDLCLATPPQLETLPPQQEAPVLRAYFVSVVEESDLCTEEDADLRHAQRLLRDYEKREGLVVVGETQNGGGEEKYEKTRARHGDAVFSGFMKKIALCPQQVLRYCRGGQPLCVSSSLSAAPPACPSCGGGRTFELQLMPALVALLRWTDSGGEAEPEFGTVLVYTCRSSCWSGSVLEEFCSVQSDPDQQLFT
ncbi:programmed cell death protein 2-like isoform X1 [Gasterosteus aculeatus]|uniref:Programmed cell death protein 2 C-terminal domain-containing protein n=1 Tax=Gasterosteus aculeatus aculeatus TaxID=481459 RepID=A0AAQ4PP61_GASAC|nr:programmed cell death protein 2-like isoform X1 [Gasterosteus aculeatus aculeatus]